MANNPISIRDRITPNTGMPRGGAGGGGAFNPWMFLGMGNSPMGTMQYPSMPDEGVANSYLEPFGFHAQQPTQNAFLPEPGTNNFFGQHPGFTRAAEGAIMGAAFTEPSMTAGEGISNVARSIMGVPMYKRQLAAQQIAAPFHGADMMASLMQRKAMADYYSQRGDYYEQRGDTEQQKFEEVQRHNLMGEQLKNAQLNNQLLQHTLDQSRKGPLETQQFNNARDAENHRRLLNDQPMMTPGEESQYWQRWHAGNVGRNAAAAGYAGTGGRRNAGILAGDVPEVDKEQGRTLGEKVKRSQRELDELDKNSKDFTWRFSHGLTDDKALMAERARRLQSVQEAQRNHDEFQSSIDRRRKLPEQRAPRNNNHTPGASDNPYR